MASILKVDEMQGVTSAGDITITSEGGSATQSLQQGLCKVWLITNAGAAAPDSLNVASMTDNGTGDYTAAYTSSMASTNYSISGISAVSGSSMNQHWVGSSSYIATGSYRMNTLYVNSLAGGGQVVDATYVSLQNMGDLA